MTPSDRRDFLKALGIGVPASVTGTTFRWPSNHLPLPTAPEEVFEIYVSECLKHCADMGLATHAGSYVRGLAEAHGAALALVLAKLQGGHDGT